MNAGVAVKLYSISLMVSSVKSSKTDRSQLHTLVRTSPVPQSAWPREELTSVAEDAQTRDDMAERLDHRADKDDPNHPLDDRPVVRKVSKVGRRLMLRKQGSRGETSVEEQPPSIVSETRRERRTHQDDTHQEAIYQVPKHEDVEEAVARQTCRVGNVLHTSFLRPKPDRAGRGESELQAASLDELEGGLGRKT